MIHVPPFATTPRVFSIVSPLASALLVSSALLLATGSFALGQTPKGGSDDKPDISPLVKRLESKITSDKLRALRALMRMKIDAETARPLLEKQLSAKDAEFRKELVPAIEELLGSSGVDLLEKLYSDPYKDVRLRAVAAGCALWPQKDAQTFCRSAMDDPDYAFRMKVVTTVRQKHAKDPAAIELFRKALDDRSEVVQRSAVFALQAARDAGSVAKLRAMARTVPDQVAIPIVEEALPAIGNADAIDALISVLPKPTPAEKGETKSSGPLRPSDLTRAAAARGLARIKATKALPALRSLLDDPSEILRLAGLRGIAAMRDGGAVGRLIELLSDRSMRVRRSTLITLRKIGPELARPAADATLKLLKDDKNAGIRAEAAGVYGLLLGKEAIAELVAAGKDSDDGVRFEAVGALTLIGKPAARALIPFLADEDLAVSAMAVEGLGEVGTKELIPDLLKVARADASEKRHVRIAVARAIGKIGGDASVDPLLELSKDTFPAVRQAAAEALAAVGGERATTRLREMMRDKSSTVRDAVRRGLAK